MKHVEQSDGRTCDQTIADVVAPPEAATSQPAGDGGGDVYRSSLDDKFTDVPLMYFGKAAEVASRGRVIRHSSIHVLYLCSCLTHISFCGGC